MVTFSGLVSQVRRDLLGYSLEQASVAALTAPMGAADTTFSADPVENLSTGLAEVGDELVLVKRIDPGSMQVTVMGGVNGRGYEGTTAAAHAVGDIVTAAPTFPRVSIKTAINDTVRNLYPSLVVFGTTEFACNAVAIGYGLPADVRDVWYVRGRDVGPTITWRSLSNWRFNPKASPADFPAGKSIEIYDLDWITPGQPVRVVYSREPGVLAADGDDFAAATGFPERIAELVRWGACSKLLPAYESGRLQQSSVESTERAALVPATSALKTAQYYLSMFQARLEEERRLMFQETENFATYQGS